MDLVRGQLVRSRAGRDATRTFAVLAVEGQMLFLADGSLRGLARPKRKKRKHVAPIAAVLPGEALASDQALRKAIAAFDAASPPTPKPNGSKAV